MMSILIIMQLPQVHDRLGNDIARCVASYVVARLELELAVHIVVMCMSLCVSKRPP